MWKYACWMSVIFSGFEPKLKRFDNFPWNSAVLNLMKISLRISNCCTRTDWRMDIWVLLGSPQGFKRVQDVCQTLISGFALYARLRACALVCLSKCVFNTKRWLETINAVYKPVVTKLCKHMGCRPFYSKAQLTHELPVLAARVSGKRIEAGPLSVNLTSLFNWREPNEMRVFSIEDFINSIGLRLNLRKRGVEMKYGYLTANKWYTVQITVSSNVTWTVKFI